MNYANGHCACTIKRNSIDLRLHCDVHTKIHTKQKEFQSKCTFDLSISVINNIVLCYASKKAKDSSCGHADPSSNEDEKTSYCSRCAVLFDFHIMPMPNPDGPA